MTIAELLISHGAEVDALQEYQRTPLHLAAFTGRTELVALLIKHGARVCACEEDQQTALNFAARFHHTELIVELLLMRSVEGFLL